MSAYRLPSPLYAICDADTCARSGWTLLDMATACLDGGARFLQVRAKALDSGPFLELSRQIVERAATAGADVIVNDRADIARLAGARGVHVGQHDLEPSSVRRLVSDSLVVGLSTHGPAELQAALSAPIDYLATGPIFPTLTKDTGYDTGGLARVREAATHASVRGLPIVAIGGITLERARDVIEAGAGSVAVISDLLATGDPAGRVRAYLQRLAL